VGKLMFATLNRFRRQIAVLAALALVSSVLVAVPVVAADDPEPNYEATFDACGDAPSSGFEDVPSGHANAGDIDCIAYYGITKGTSATTYSPLMSVTREHMALFLVRLADLVGIDVPEAGDTGFTDTADLSANAQAAISQLRQLGITQGTSATTYSPADSVTRGQMAQFISRLMNLMTPLTDGDPSLDDTTFYGYTPALVAENEKVTVENQDGEEEEPEIKSSFTDLGPVSKNQYDAITQLYELGVASGISDTAFAPSALMTRAAMAGFMAAMLDHSNARPAGVSAQADKTFDYGEYVATVMVSVRDDEFGATADQLVDIFQSDCVDTCGEAAHFVTSGDDAGKCKTDKLSAGDCMWNTDDHQTDGNGNIFFGADIGETDDDDDSDKAHTVYAWIGSETGDEFNVDDDDYASVTAMWTPERDSVGVSTSINKEAADALDRTTTDAPADSGKLVHLGSTRSVVVTGQLQDSSDGAVKQGGVEVTVSWVRYVFDRGEDGTAAATDTHAITYENSDEATLTTNDDGKVTFTVDAPRDIKSQEDQDVVDMVTFTVDADTEGSVVNTTGSTTFNWVEDTRIYQKTTIEATNYVLVDGDGDEDDDANINVSARLYDQYGNGIRVDENGNAYRITLTLGGANGTDYSIDTDPDTAGVQAVGAVTKTPSISSSSSRRGMARALFAVNNIAVGTHGLDVTFQIENADVDADGELTDSVVDDPADPTTLGLQIGYTSLTDAEVYGEAAAATGTTDPDTNEEGISGTYVYVEAKASDGDNKQVDVHQTYGGDAEKKIPATHFATAGGDDGHGVLYAMDDNDTYIKDGETPAPCVTLRPEVDQQVRVVIYATDSDKASIFDIDTELTQG
nr:S-layer homology domain-containing protein [Acidimicrobiia bacterium]